MEKINIFPTYEEFLLEGLQLDWWKEQPGEKEFDGVIELKFTGGAQYQYELTDKDAVAQFKKLIKYKPGKALDVLKKWSLNILKYDEKTKKWNIIDK